MFLTSLKMKSSGFHTFYVQESVNNDFEIYFIKMIDTCLWRPYSCTNILFETLMFQIPFYFNDRGINLMFKHQNFRLYCMEL